MPRLARSLSFITIALLGVAMPVSAQTPTRTHTIHSKRAHLYEAISKYPVLKGKTPLAVFANRAIATDVRKIQNTFIALVLHDTSKEPANNPYDFDADPMYQRYRAPHLYSVGMVYYEFMGGAHGNSWRIAYNFALVNGKPQRMYLKDFFKDGSDYRKQIETKLRDKLNNDKRADFISEVAQFSPTQLNRFFVEPDGLRFWFDPYEVASYAQGPVDVKLTFADLGPDFKRSLVK